jgi:hypothetical protein
MEDRRATLRRKIEILKGYLREGVPGDLAATYLFEIAETEEELRQLEGGPSGTDRRS